MTKGNIGALTKKHLPKDDFIVWWESSSSVENFVATAKENGYEITRDSAIARAGRLRKAHTKSGRPKKAWPLKWMGRKPAIDEDELMKRLLAIKAKNNRSQS